MAAQQRRNTPLPLEDVDTIVDHTVDALPESVKEALGHVDVMIVEDHKDPVLTGVTDDDGNPLPADFRGFYQGTTVEGLPEDEDESDPPEGIIFLNCAQLFSQGDVVQTLYHEIGHALGLDEDEVENLGL